MKRIKAKPRTKPRNKTFIVYGRFYPERAENARIEIWHGEARSMATAVRKAVREFWRNKRVRWKHHRSVNLHVTTNSLPLEQLPLNQRVEGTPP